MNNLFQGRDGGLRIYDNSQIPYYVEIPFVEMDFAGPLGRESDSPAQISFSFHLTDKAFPIIESALWDIGSAWKVGPHSWKAFISSDAGQFTGNVEVQWRILECPSFFARRYNQVYFPPRLAFLRESADFVNIQVSGLVYGDIQRIPAFSEGVSSLIYE